MTATVRRAEVPEPTSSDPLASWLVMDEPYYAPTGREIEAFQAAYALRVPLLLKGPTGCGKTRFVQHMAWRLRRPLVIIACNEDTTVADLVGRWLLNTDGTHWHDGPLTLAARHGAICYLDEMVEARPDTTVVIHPLTDSRRVLPLDRHNELVRAHPDFQLVASYNPGYRGALKGLKTSTRQRFCAMNFTYPPADVEARIVARESGLTHAVAERLVALGRRTRELEDSGLDEGASTRMLVHAGGLIGQGLEPVEACRLALVAALTDEPDLAVALEAAVDAAF